MGWKDALVVKSIAHELDHISNMLTTTCNPSSWGSDALLWCPQVLHPHGAQTCR